MNVSSVALIHLIKLVNTADTCVSEHKSTTFEYKFTGDGVFQHCSRETDARATLTGRVDATR